MPFWNLAAAVVCALLSISGCAATTSRIGPDPKSSSLVYLGPEEEAKLRRSHYTYLLALHQATPLEPSRCTVRDDCLMKEAARILITPSFDTTWLLSIVQFSDKGGSDAFISASSFDPHSDNDTNVGDVTVKDNVVTTYSAALSFEEFSTLIRSLKKSGVLAKPATGTPLLWEGTSERKLCVDGVGWSFEALLGDVANYFSRGACSAEYASDFLAVEPIVSMAFVKLPMIAADVGELSRYIATFVADTDPG